MSVSSWRLQMVSGKTQAQNLSRSHHLLHVDPYSDHLFSVEPSIDTLTARVLFSSAPLSHLSSEHSHSSNASASHRWSRLHWGNVCGYWLPWNINQQVRSYSALVYFIWLVLDASDGRFQSSSDTRHSALASSCRRWSYGARLMIRIVGLWIHSSFMSADTSFITSNMYVRRRIPRPNPIGTTQTSRSSTNNTQQQKEHNTNTQQQQQ